ncbi:hypothetical protein [Pedobacter cryophilus]|uniref:Lipoprotein n=1 Tax=Pedobacter cryophilus TaxID=2571271 RepID=A0A4U1C4H0_9SPHI|nr:hypothetical protein [Pedobacter cryophilus]TKC00786.1 hypothetical protein FA046_03670 [Pedobacter cryophilus]
MKLKIITISAFLGFVLFVSSCSFKMKAKNLPAGLPDYTAYNNGDTVFTDGSIKKAIEPIKVEKKEVSEVKKGQSFTVFSEGTSYQGSYYGKLNVFTEYGGRQYTGMQYNSPTGNSMGPSYQSTYNYYIQKRGQNEVYKFSLNQLKELITDNPLAFRKASAAKIYSKIAIPSVLIAITGITAGVFLKEGPIKSIAGTAGLIALPLYIITLPIASAKSKNAIKVYNR